MLADRLTAELAKVGVKFVSKPKVFIYTPVDQTGVSHQQLEQAGCDLKLSPEDINELFNEIDVERRNKITRSMFVDVTTFILGKLGGGSAIEKSMSKGSL